jgi:prepilin-type processing-associated H-X9-DG protein
LAAILLPVFARARENARRASCQSNLKQLALGVMQYTQDNDERFPLLVEGTSGGMFFTSGTNRNETWCDRIFPYVKSKQVYICPSVGKSEANTIRDYSHYGMNLFISRPFNAPYHGTLETIQFPLSAVLRPSEVVLLADTRKANPSTVGAMGFTNNYNFDGGGYAYYIAMPGAAGWGVDARFDPVNGRHLSGANFAFIDGHVKWEPFILGNGTSIGDESAVYSRVNIINDANNCRVDWTVASQADARRFWAPYL